MNVRKKISQYGGRANDKRPLESGLFSSLARSAALVSNLGGIAGRTAMIVNAMAERSYGALRALQNSLRTRSLSSSERNAMGLPSSPMVKCPLKASGMPS